MTLLIYYGLLMLSINKFNFHAVYQYEPILNFSRIIQKSCSIESEETMYKS